MDSFSKFLDKFKSILLSSGIIKKTILNAIAAATHIELTEKDIEIKNRVIYIQSHTLIKNEIFMKKDLILKDLKALLGEKAPRDIR